MPAPDVLFSHDRAEPARHGGNTKPKARKTDHRKARNDSEQEEEHGADSECAWVSKDLRCATSEPSDPESPSEATRVTTRPAAVEIKSAGICETRPSPIVSNPGSMRRGDVHSAHHRSDGEAAEDIDDGDHDARDRIASSQISSRLSIAP
ncbi:MAG: hypothetical protein R3A47_02675 [Polyangiales bacterium]